MSRYNRVKPTNQTIRLLRPGVVDPDTGALDYKRVRGADPDRQRRLNEQSQPYTSEEVRTAIAMWHTLPEDTPIVLDLKRVYPWLARYHRDVFDLYAAGYSMSEIANAYRAVRPSGFKFTARPDRGSRIVRQLVDEVLSLLPLREEVLKVGQIITPKGFRDSGN